MLQSTRSQRIGHDWATEQQQHTVNITYMHRETKKTSCNFLFQYLLYCCGLKSNSQYLRGMPKIVYGPYKQQKVKNYTMTSKMQKKHLTKFNATHEKKPSADLE